MHLYDSSKLHTQKGFTLIEILIVIVIIGILAVGLIATLDPLEQIRKSTDTTNAKIAKDISDAMLRYYASNTQMPWESGINTQCTEAPSAKSIMEFESCLQVLADAGESKNPESIAGALGTNAGQMFVTGYSAGDENYPQTKVCFKFQSKNFKTKKGNVFTDNVGTTQAESSVEAKYFCIIQ